MLTKDTNRRLIERNESWPSYPDGTLVMTGDNVQVTEFGEWRDETVSEQSCDRCPSADVSDKTCSQAFVEDIAKRIKELMKDGVE